MNSTSEQRPPSWTITRLLEWTKDHLEHNHVEDARLATEVLLAHALGCSRIDLYTKFDQVPAQEKLDRFRDWVKRAGDGEPIAYLVEEKEFFSLSFRVSPDVLIPRPETETLVECVLDFFGRNDLSEPTLLDVGTGSGCVAIAVLSQRADMRVVATDISPGALAVARDNAQRLGVSNRVDFIAADRLAFAPKWVPDGGFDVLVSNPPYVAGDAMADLQPSVRDYEPTDALTDGEDGLSFYRTIATDGPALLSDAGCVFVEVGAGQAASVIEAMEARGGLVHQETWRDRVVGAERVLCFGRK